MHIRRGYLGWGVFLILAGAVPLAVRAGYLTDDQIDRLWTLWPLILVGIGVGLILSRTRFDFVGGLVVAATLGLIAGGILSSGVGTLSSGACGQDAGTAAFPPREGVFSPAGGSVEVEIDCGNVTLGAGSGDGLAGGGPGCRRHRAADRGHRDDASVEPRDDDANGFWAFGRAGRWQITVPQAVPVDLDLRMNAGQATVDLSGLSWASSRSNSTQAPRPSISGRPRRSSGIEIRLNAGSLGVTLPHVSMTGSIHANAGAVRLCAAGGRRVEAACRGEHRRELRLRRPWPRPGRLDLDDARLRRGVRADRIDDRRERGFVRPGSRGRL